MARFDETSPYQDDQTHPRQPDPPTVPAHAQPAARTPSRAPRRSATPATVLFGMGSLMLVIVLGWLLLGGRGRSMPCCIITPTPSLIPSATVVPSATAATLACAALAEFRGAGAPQTGSSHFAFVFPAGLVGYRAAADTEVGGYQMRTLRLCAPGSGTPLTDALNALFVAAHWQSSPLGTPLAAAARCQNACWTATFPVTGGAAQEVAGLSASATQGMAQTATLTLTIPPFSAGTMTLDAAMPIFNFAPGTQNPPDVQFSAPEAVLLLDNTLYAPIPAGEVDIIYTAIRALGYTNPGHPIMLATNSRIALQGNAGRFSVVSVTQAQPGTITFAWVTYPYGF